MESINDALKKNTLNSKQAIKLCTEMKVSYKNTTICIFFDMMLS